MGFLDLEDFGNRFEKKAGAPVLEFLRKRVSVVGHADDVPHDPVGSLLADALHEPRVLGTDAVRRSGTGKADRLDAERFEPGSKLHHLPGPNDSVGTGNHQRTTLAGSSEHLGYGVARIEGELPISKNIRDRTKSQCLEC